MEEEEFLLVNNEDFIDDMVRVDFNIISHM